MQAQELVLQCRGRPLSRPLSFSCALGQALEIRGPNGVGKTTLLRTLAGFLPPLAGHYTVPSVGYIDLAGGLYPRLRVAEQWDFWELPACLRGPGRALEQLGLWSLSAVPIEGLSSGQKRRLALLPLLFKEVDLWLLDEPDTHLDPAGRGWLEARLSVLLAVGKMVIYSTQTQPLCAVQGVLEMPACSEGGMHA